MVTNPGTQTSTKVRLRRIEELMLSGYSTGEIHEIITGEDFGTVYGTTRNDVGKINKAHARAIDKTTRLKGRTEYLARSTILRRKALSSDDLKLVHELDKELARFCGVSLKNDTKNLAITVERAKEYLDQVMGVVFTHVKDEETRDLIIVGLALIDEQD